MKIAVAWIGKAKDASLQSLTAEYLKRLSRYAQVEGREFKSESDLLKFADGPGRSRTKSRLALLEASGTQFSSEEFAKFIGSYQDRDSRPLVFAVGPPDGFSDQARSRAFLVIALGRMTLSHELARVVLLEQLYRAFTILAGHPYHSGH
ncbi:MAG: 23S rRNA (pseudouridine(1915)-N(3))-methyltransferase RlmH [Acidobacteriales bacterium]|nr:23S rRNA (pseudouridine(1915)-N(3))-methyltransferase RlmH [Terriglobales bacterium]